MSNRRKKARQPVPVTTLDILSATEKIALGLAGELEAASQEWRIQQGYTGTSVHKPEFFYHLAQQMLKAGWWNRDRTPCEFLPKKDLQAMMKHNECAMGIFGGLHPQTVEFIRRMKEDIEVGPLTAEAV